MKILAWSTKDKILISEQYIDSKNSLKLVVVLKSKNIWKRQYFFYCFNVWKSLNVQFSEYFLSILKVNWKREDGSSRSGYFYVLFVYHSRWKFSSVSLNTCSYKNCRYLTAFGGSWTYEENVPGLYGPSQWGFVNPSCIGQRQRWFQKQISS